MFLINSRLAFLSATPKSSAGKRHHFPGRPFSRSYGALLPSSLAEVRPNALGRLSLPTSVGLRYGHPSSIAARLFLSVWAQRSFHPPRWTNSLIPQLVTPERIYLSRHGLQTRTRHIQWTRSIYPAAPPLGFKRKSGGVGILTYCPSSSAFAYDLGPTNPTPMSVA